MSEKKTIQVNPNFLLGKKSNKTEKKNKRDKNSFKSLIKPNNVKNSLINKIKNFQKNEKNKTKDIPENKSDEFTKDFTNQLSYLENIIKKKKEKKREKREKKRANSLKKQANSLKKPDIRQTGGQLDNIKNNFPKMEEINVVIPEDSTLSLNNNVKPTVTINDSQTKPFITNNKTQKEPPYGCLKGGSKPTFSQYQQTMKNNKQNNSNNSNKPQTLNFQEPPNINNKFERQEKLKTLKNMIATPKKEPVEEKPKKNLRNKTIKIFNLGKKGNKVGVLVKSALTRKKVKDEQKVLKERSLSDVKKYLKKHNLIRAGTCAPEDVLRKMYEESYLSGNVFNKNPENLLHNYLNSEEWN
tara:strand:- start:118 stop:1182 length:1065 start_codon:yes stop_codon:yes gene_type:complete